MKYKKGVIFICLIICLFSIASVCASEVNETVVANEDQSEEIMTVENENLESLLLEQSIELKSDNSSFSKYGDNKVEYDCDKDELLNFYNDDVIMDNNQESFSYLYNLIETSSVVYLNKDIYYYGGAYEDIHEDGILIHHSVIINGNGHYIDGKDKARAFNLCWENGYDDITLTLINLTIKNCKHKSGGAIKIDRANLHIINCTFENNYDNIYTCTDIYGKSNDFSLIGTKFINPKFQNSDVKYMIRLEGNNFLIDSCDFYNNTLLAMGGAISLLGNNILIKNCNFNKYGRYKQAIEVEGTNITISNCNFINNTGGGICFSSVESGIIKNCYFTENWKDSIIFEENSKNCKLINSTFENNAKPIISWTCAFGDIISCHFLENADYSQIFNGESSYCNRINNTGYGIPTIISIDKNEIYFKDKFLIHFTDINGNRIPSTKLIIDIGIYHYEMETPAYSQNYISLDISNIQKEGNYISNIYFTGSDNYESTSIQEILSIKLKRNTTLYVPNITSYISDVSLIGNLYSDSTDSLNGDINIFCNNNTYIIPAEKNFIGHLNLSPGVYEVITTYGGNNIYYPCKTISTITVLSSIILNDFKNEYKNAVNFNTKFLDENGNILEYQYVLFTVDGEDNVLITNSQGFVNFNKQLTSGVHTFKIVNPITKEQITVKTKSVIPTKITLTLKKVKVKRSAKRLVISATLKINGKVAKGKIIKFKFNKKSYKAKTNAKGVAKITVKKTVLKKLKVGKKVKYQATYGKVTKKLTVKVKK